MGIGQRRRRAGGRLRAEGGLGSGIRGQRWRWHCGRGRAGRRSGPPVGLGWRWGAGRDRLPLGQLRGAPGRGRDPGQPAGGDRDVHGACGFEHRDQSGPLHHRSWRGGGASESDRSGQGASAHHRDRGGARLPVARARGDRPFGPAEPDRAGVVDAGVADARGYRLSGVPGSPGPPACGSHQPWAVSGRTRRGGLAHDAGGGGPAHGSWRAVGGFCDRAGDGRVCVLPELASARGALPEPGRSAGPSPDHRLRTDGNVAAGLGRDLQPSRPGESLRAHPPRGGPQVCLRSADESRALGGQPGLHLARAGGSGVVQWGAALARGLPLLHAALGAGGHHATAQIAPRPRTGHRHPLDCAVRHPAVRLPVVPQRRGNPRGIGADADAAPRARDRQRGGFSRAGGQRLEQLAERGRGAHGRTGSHAALPGVGGRRCPLRSGVVAVLRGAEPGGGRERRALPGRRRVEHPARELVGRGKDRGVADHAADLRPPLHGDVAGPARRGGHSQCSPGRHPGFVHRLRPGSRGPAAGAIPRLARLVVVRPDQPRAVPRGLRPGRFRGCGRGARQRGGLVWPAPLGLSRPAGGRRLHLLRGRLGSLCGPVEPR